MVVRDHAWFIIFVASFLSMKHSPYATKVPALNLAFDTTSKNNWINMLWSCDDQFSDKRFIEAGEPSGWHTQFDFVQIKNRFTSSNWH